MAEHRFSKITDQMGNKGYSFRPLSKDQDIYKGLCGYYIRATHEKKPDEDYLVLLTRKELDFHSIHAIKYANMPDVRIHAIEKDYVAYHFQERLLPHRLDQLVHQFLEKAIPFFARPGAPVSRRVAWMTDIHLNFLETEQRERFIRTILQASPDALLISGDIGESQDFSIYLKEIESKYQKPIYFVLGNHDFYYGSISDVCAEADRLGRQYPNLCWLTGRNEPVEIGERTGLIGHESWADGRNGDFFGSQIIMNDYLLVKDLFNLDQKTLLKKLNALGKKAAEEIEGKVARGFSSFDRLVLVMHIPPFEQACAYDGILSTQEWLPHISCKAVGDCLLKMMNERPEKELTILCGHTHGISVARLLDNLVVLTGEAEYSSPAIQCVFEIA